jgi:hypothetical protein
MPGALLAPHIDGVVLRPTPRAANHPFLLLRL